MNIPETEEFADIHTNLRGLTLRESSDGSTATYYELPIWARELADLIRYKKMNGSQAEAFRCLYRGSEASHSDEQRQAKKLLCYAVDEVVRTHFPERSFAPFRNAVFTAIFEEDSKVPHHDKSKT